MILRTSVCVIACCFVGLLLAPMTAQSAPKPSAFTTVKQDLSHPATEAEVVKLATTSRTQAAALLRGKAKTDVEKLLKLLQDPDPAKQAKAAWSMSGAAMLMMGAAQQKEVATVLCTAPVELFPRDPLLVSNFTALLRMLELQKEALAVLLYANGLSPGWPVVLTNLGNTLFELGDDLKAGDFFRQALKIDPHFRDARSGLVLVHLKHRDAGAAYAELLRGVEEVTFTESTAQQFAKVSNDGARAAAAGASTAPPPPPPASPRAPASGPNSGRTPDQLKLPPFPESSVLAAFLAANGPTAWEKEISQGLAAEIATLTDLAEKKANRVQAISRLPRDDQARAMEALAAAPFAQTVERNQFAMAVMQQYVEDRFAKIDKDYADGNDKEGKKFNDSFMQINEAFRIKSEALAKTMKAAGPAGLRVLPEYQKLMIENCTQNKLLAEDFYQAWKKLARVRHERTNDLLQEYWVYCEQYLNPLFGEDFDLLNHQRSFYVYTKLLGLAAEYPVRKLAFIGVGGGGANGAGDCGTPAPLPAAGDAPMTTVIPKRKGPPCPFENAKAKCGLGPASIALDCDSIEFEFLEGIGVATKWNFKKKELTVLPEAGFKFELGAPGLKVGEVSFKEGVAITFDRNGKTKDVAWVMEAGGSLNVGAGAVGGTATLTYSAVTGIKTELGQELGLSH